MVELESMIEMPFQELLVIPIIECSGAVYGNIIGQVNEAMAEISSQLAEINDELVDSTIRIAPMEFSSGARWFALENDKPAEVESFRWIDMKASGLADLGAAFKLLNEKLTVEEKGGWMKRRGSLAPVIILISSGIPTDDYKSKLEKLKKCGWFKAALKFAVAVGADADKNMLAEFTGNEETIIGLDVIRNNLYQIIRSTYYYDDDVCEPCCNEIIKEEEIETGNYFSKKIQSELRHIFTQSKGGALTNKKKKALQAYLDIIIEEEISTKNFVSISPTSNNYIVIAKKACMLINVYGIKIISEDELFVQDRKFLKNIQWIEDDKLVTFEIWNLQDKTVQTCICHYSNDGKDFIYFTPTIEINESKTLFDDLF